MRMWEGDQGINTCVWGREDLGINTCVWGREDQGINTCVWGRGTIQGSNTCVGGGKGTRELIRVVWCVCVCVGGEQGSNTCVCGGEDQVIFVCGRGEGPRNYYMYVRDQILMHICVEGQRN